MKLEHTYLAVLFVFCCVLICWMIGDLSIHMRTRDRCEVSNELVTIGRIMEISCDRLSYCVSQQLTCRSID